MAVDKRPDIDRLRFRHTASGSGSSSSLTAQPQCAGVQFTVDIRGPQPDSWDDAGRFSHDQREYKLEYARHQSEREGKNEACVFHLGGGCPLNEFEKKGKGKRREANGVKKRPTDGLLMDPDVSMADVNITLINPGPSDSGLKPRRREMLPPPISNSKSAHCNPGSGSSSAPSSVRNRQVGHSRHSALDSTCVASPSGGPLEEAMIDIEEPEIQLHPLLEKKRLKEAPAPPNASHSSLQGSPRPPRLEWEGRAWLLYLRRRQGYRSRSPFTFPPTPESVFKGGSSETGNREGITSEIKGIQDQGGGMDGVEGGDPDSFI
ncbi:hypothetical protein F5887DRAFT_1159157 [Amanita rubescens]|nr:hypothetical protein F5887DRAFT_1159157 [Amanita rubescens]